MAKSKPYKTCPHCGANLDPGEPCDCREWREKHAGGPEDEREPDPHPYITTTERAAS